MLTFRCFSLPLKRPSKAHPTRTQCHIFAQLFGVLFACLFLGCVDEKTVEGQLQYLSSTYSLKRFEAARRLGEMGKQARAAVPALRRRLVIDTEPNVRLESARALGKIGDTSALPELIRALGDEVEDVRIKASHALGELGAPAVKPLQTLLSKPLPLDTAYHAVAALGHIGAPSLPALRTLLRSGSDKIRHKVVEALKQIGPAAGELLLLAMEDESSSVRAYTAWTLMRIGPKLLKHQPLLQKKFLQILQKALQDKDDKARMYAVLALRSLGKLGASSTPMLRKLLLDKLWYIRKTAASTLAGLGDAAEIAIPELLLALQDDTWDVRQEASAALLQLKNKRILPSLERLLQDHRPHVRRTAAQMIFHLQPDPTTEQRKRLFGRLQDPSSMVRETIRDLLARLQPPPLDQLFLLAQGKSEQTAEQALRVIKELGTKAKSLHPLLRSSLLSRVRSAPFQKALASAILATAPKLPTTSPQTRLEQLRSGSPKERRQIILHLGLLPELSPQTQQALRLALRDTDITVRLHAALVFGWHAKQLDADSVYALRSASRRDANQPIRLASLDALGWSGSKALPHLSFLFQRLAKVSAEEQKRILATLQSIGPTQASLQGLLQASRRAKPPLLAGILALLPNFATTLFPKKAPKEPILRKLRETLERALVHANPAIRQRAATAYSELGEHGIPSISALQRLLSDNHTAVRSAAAHALGWLGREAAPAASKLAYLLKEKDPFLQRNVVFALRRIGPKALPYLNKSLLAAPPRLQRNIVYALSYGVIGFNEMGETLRALEKLQATLPSNSPLRDRIQRASVHIRSSDKPYILWVDHPRSPTFDAFTPQLLLPHTPEPRPLKL